MSAAAVPARGTACSDSLRTRILLAILLWVTLGIVGIWYSATTLFAKHVERSYHDELSVHIEELAGLVRVDAGGELMLDRPLSDPRYLVPLSGFYWQIDVPDRPPMGSASMTRGSLAGQVARDDAIRHRVERGPTGATITYGVVRHVPRVGAVKFLVATDQRILDETVASFTHELTIWLAALAAALVATGFAAVSFGLQPLDRLSRASARLRSGAAARLDGDYPSEVAPLVEDLNAFIDYNRVTVERARVEAGNLAHALRTPLAVITDEAERLLQRAETRESAHSLLDQGQTMVQQIEYHLARARSAAGARGPTTQCRVDEVLPPILSAMRRLHPGKQFEFVALDAAESSWPLDPVDFAELLSILLDNAGKWSRRNIVVELTGNAETLQLRIVDDGPGLAPENTVTAFEIGTRFDPSKPGSGLGLAIAHDIAQAYDLQIALGARSDGRSGLEARITVTLGAAPTA